MIKQKKVLMNILVLMEHKWVINPVYFVRTSKKEMIQKLKTI